ncbi:hypothetical protein LV780_15965 [Cereibacter azotoformans]|uniref:Copper-binding protein n=1 Tax=Cereibacter azotoformans TaxID=43057 RepID=A0A2T5K6C7_9RHOB|nr:hypothetical protein [Cereibacter azotoformans]AXQ95853.1 hypothetical protein D0Z66_19320 [Cereibacter sphaeroides]PTR17975.1 hypothetical protein C8J28_11099 [Cereibacter azotoformans]UIJ32636.1 hypothetical protein LV780_15965 [Cereibacter azotoformans]
MKNLLAVTAAALALASSVSAGELVLDAPMQARSLHEGALDLVAYRNDLADGGMEVTAAFRARTPSGEPQVVKMLLQDQDRVQFSMPSDLRTIYTFARAGDRVTVGAEPVAFSLASQ